MTMYKEIGTRTSIKQYYGCMKHREELMNSLQDEEDE
jgi:hypothetical protein